MSDVAANPAAFGFPTEARFEPCPKCEGSGELVYRTGLDTEAVYECPRCGGSGSVEDDRAPVFTTRTQAQLDEEFGKELPF